jgi:PIN domain nuclease of toxin-antitoxin system
MLENKKRITLKENALLWLKRALSAPGISIYPLTPEIAYESSNLPGIFHGDPADRIIVSTVRVSKGSLLTLDKKIHEYSNEGYVNVIFPARKSGSGE